MSRPGGSPLRGRLRRAGGGRRAAKAVATFTVVGYALALCVSAYLLWTLGGFEDTEPLMVVTETVVLALPASLGAAAARLVL